MRRYQLNGYPKQVLSFTLAAGMMIGQFALPLLSYAESRLPSLEQLSAKQASGTKASALNGLPVRGQITLTRDVDIAPPAKKVSLNMRDANIRDILNLLAKQGGFNIVLDESINGNLTIDINNISINKALEYIFTVSNFAYSRDGNTLIVASQEVAEEKNLAAKTFKAIPVQYKSAEQLATQLNNTIFSINRPNGQKTAVIAYDGSSNSLLVMGSDSDLKLVADFLREMDVPRNRKVYPIRHNRPEYVANSIIANLFTPANFGSFGEDAATANASGGNANGGGAANAGGNNGGAAGGGAAGGNNGGGNANGGAGGNGGAANGVTSPLPLVFNTGGVTLIADAVSSTITAMGTEEQMALIDSIIDQVDVRRPQVAIEVALVEMSATDTKQFLPSNAPWQVGKFQLSFPGTLTGNSGFLFNGSALAGNESPLHSFSASMANIQRRVKVLANPTIIAMDGQQSTINVNDQVATINNTVTVTAGVTNITANITTTPVGISLVVTPRVYNDGSVDLTLTPTVSSPGETVTAGSVVAPSQITLVSTRSMQLNGVRIPDGQTLVIGGLLNTNQNKNNNKIPILGDIPLLGSLVNQQDSRQLKSELVIVVTPHILKDDGVTYFSNPPQAQSNYNSPNQGRIQPVGLPKFMGDEAVFPSGKQSNVPDANGLGQQSALPALGVQKVAAADLIGPPVQEEKSFGMITGSTPSLNNENLVIQPGETRLDIPLEEPNLPVPAAETPSKRKNFIK